MAGLGRQQTSTATFGFESPSWGFTIQSSKEQAVGVDVGRTSINVGAGIGEIARVAGVAGVKPLQRGTMQSVSTDIRLIRGKDAAGLWLTDEINQQAEQLLNALMAWQGGASDGENPYEGALAKVLLADDSVVVAQSVRESTRYSSSASAGASVSSRVGRGGVEENFRAGLGMQAERVREQKRESREEDGHTGLAARETASHVVSRTTFGLFRAVGGHGNVADFDADSPFRVPVPLGGITLDWSPMDKNTKIGATQFPIGERRGGSLDRTESSPDRLIAELKGNMDAWLLRAMDVLPRAVGDEAIPTEQQKLQAAAHMLKQFVEALKLAPLQTVQYGIKYELNPALTGWVDGLEALRNLGGQTGNDDLSSRAVGAAADLLHSHVAWMPKTVSARPTGSVSTGRQINVFGVIGSAGESASANFSHINFPR